MVLVHPDLRRLGIGTRLLQHAIEHLQRQGSPSIKLDATSTGRKVYVPIGFVDECVVSRFEGIAPNRVEREQIEEYGFTVQREFTRMFLGENSRPGSPDRVFGTGGAEKG